MPGDPRFRTVPWILPTPSERFSKLIDLKKAKARSLTRLSPAPATMACEPASLSEPASGGLGLQLRRLRESKASASEFRAKEIWSQGVRYSLAVSGLGLIGGKA